MKDIRLYIDKLHTDAADCLTISQAANNDAKRKVFLALAETYRKLAADLETIAAANAVLDEERDKHLLGMVGGGGDAAHSVATIAKAYKS